MSSVYLKYHALAPGERNSSPVINVSPVINGGHIPGERGEEKEPLKMLMSAQTQWILGSL